MNRLVAGEPPRGGFDPSDVEQADPGVLLRALHQAGATICARPQQMVVHLDLRPDGVTHVLCPDGARDQLRQQLQADGWAVDTADEAIQVHGRRKDRRQLLYFELPLRLDTMNDQLRQHWAAKRRALRELSWMVIQAVGLQARPAEPWKGIGIRIERFSPQRPDDGNLAASDKLLLDVLQPFHSSRRPYGLGFIQDDASWCLTESRVVHVPNRERRTRVWLYRTVDPNKE